MYVVQVIIENSEKNLVRFSGALRICAVSLIHGKLSGLELLVKRNVFV